MDHPYNHHHYHVMLSTLFITIDLCLFTQRLDWEVAQVQASWQKTGHLRHTGGLAMISVSTNALGAQQKWTFSCSSWNEIGPDNSAWLRYVQIIQLNTAFLLLLSITIPMSLRAFFGPLPFSVAFLLIEAFKVLNFFRFVYVDMFLRSMKCKLNYNLEKKDLKISKAF